MPIKVKITSPAQAELKRELEQEAAAHKETQAAHEKSLERQMVLERQLSDLRSTFMETERNLAIAQDELESAKKKIDRLSKLRKDAEARSMRHQFIDIYNFQGFKHEYDRFVRELARGMWNSGTIVYLDLDGFKLVNDLLGHDVGNQLLISFSECLHNESRPEDISACLHGDEFALILPDASKKDAEVIMERMHKASARITAGDRDYKHIYAELERNQLVEFSCGYFTILRGDPVLPVEDILAKAEATVPKFSYRRRAGDR